VQTLVAISTRGFRAKPEEAGNSTGSVLQQLFAV